ncbi:hypothetical protein [Vibrio renipiscarius]|uniref:hypothetical protein n=1 Tax=Vibrio renipiscarius TaxID=1461322 RepID=UPI000699EF2C|nr:hypothetical protein [Vibrio renipiscarius]
MKNSKLEAFINKSIGMWGDRLDYSLVEYINQRTSVKLICNKHREQSFFLQTPKSHFMCKHHPCPHCYKEESGKFQNLWREDPNHWKNKTEEYSDLVITNYDFTLINLVLK